MLKEVIFPGLSTAIYQLRFIVDEFSWFQTPSVAYVLLDIFSLQKKLFCMLQK